MAQSSLTPFRSGSPAERGFGRDPFLSLHREVNRLFDDVFHGRFGGQMAAGSQQDGGMIVPDIDVSENDKEVRICAELPGVSQGDIDVSLDNEVLTIRGEKKFERKDDKENFHFVERSYGTFERSLRLPYSVNAEQVQANFDNGVLTVVLPKGEEQEHRRRIQVKGGGSKQSSK